MASASLAGYSMTGWSSKYFRPQLDLPPVVYPPYCGKGLVMRYFLQSKILALAFLILGAAFFVEFVCMFLPFWFILQFNQADSTFGSEGTRQLTEDTGIIFYSSDNFYSLLFMEKMSNREVVPGLFKLAQVMEVLSVAAVGCSMVGAAILAFRKYSSMTGTIFLASLGTFGAVGQIVMVVLALFSLLSSANDVCESSTAGCTYTDNQVWRNLPFKEQHPRLVLHATPKMEANWAVYIAMIGAALAVAGCVLLWIEGLMVCRKVGDIRYKQLRDKRDLYEGERHPTEFIYSPPAPARHTYRPPPSSYTESSVYSGPAGPAVGFRAPGPGVGFRPSAEPGYSSRAMDM